MLIAGLSVAAACVVALAAYAYPVQSFGGDGTCGYHYCASVDCPGHPSQQKEL